jgi:hypothetical protein
MRAEIETVESFGFNISDNHSSQYLLVSEIDSLVI